MGTFSDFDFRNDLAFGQWKETELRNALENKTFECKADRKQRETGNVFIEYQQRGRPSGIAITKADFYAIEFADDCWILIPTPRLKEITRQVMRERRAMGKQMGTRGGDNENVGVLVPITRLITGGGE